MRVATLALLFATVSAQDEGDLHGYRWRFYDGFCVPTNREVGGSVVYNKDLSSDEAKYQCVADAIKKYGDDIGAVNII